MAGMRATPSRSASRAALAALVALSAAHGCMSVAYVDDEDVKGSGPGGGVDGGAPDAAGGDADAGADAGAEDACAPRTCADVGVECGEAPDGCGGTAVCPPCGAGKACDDKTRTCVDPCGPTTCADANAGCGVFHDGCGAPHDCGGCPVGTGTCIDNQCTCLGSETCGNAVDDDCDGDVDEGCVVDCDGAPGAGNCNTDLGYGDKCAPQDNANHCDDYWFYGWCRRRSEPDTWTAAMEKWVDDHCDGDVTRTDGDDIVFDCVASDGVLYTCKTPIVLVRAGQAISFHAGPADVFDLTGQGVCHDADWPAPATPWLALDRDHDGVIGSGEELFGSATPLARGGRARHGFEALRELDADGDGAITARDPAFADLVVWTDRDGDRRSTPDELEPAPAWGVVAIELAYRVAPACDDRGNCARERARLVHRDAQGGLAHGEAVDVHLAAR
jgi:hypothetical protein